jgi:hypothetical protein
MLARRGQDGAIVCAGSRISVSLVEEFVVDIGPELFEEGRSPIDGETCHPKTKGLAKGAFLAWIVKGGDACGCPGAEYFGGVEDGTAAVGSSDRDAGDSISEPLAKAATTERVIAGILVQSCGQDELNPKIFVHVVGIGVPVIPSVGRGALMKLRGGIARLRDPGLYRYKDKRRVVDAIECRCIEFLLDGLRRKMLVGADRAKVWNDVENTFRLHPVVSSLSGWHVVLNVGWRGRDLRLQP